MNEKIQSPDNKKQSLKTSGFNVLTEERSSASNSIDIPSISLPKGGGALKGIDEKFAVNAANGTSSFSMSLPLSPGRGGFSPSVSINYNSGSGNGILGMGWAFGITSIKRKTDKGLPLYQDTHEKEDTFIFSGAEDLVPLLQQNNEGEWLPKQFEENGFSVKCYRPRIEGGFSKIERIGHAIQGEFWKVTTRENIVTFFGLNHLSRIADPSENTRIFEWLPAFAYDNKGNCVIYNYKEENLDKVPATIYEKNRINGISPFTNKYLKRLIYGHETPYYADPAKPYEPELPENTFFFEAVFDYGEHDESQPVPEESNSQLWDYRSDPFSSARSGFEIRTNRLCKRVLMFHRFPDLNSGTATLVRSLDFEYLTSDGLKEKSTRPAELSYLTGIIQKGYIKKADNSYSVKVMPKMSFDYQWLNWNTEIKAVKAESLLNAPTGLSNNYQWVDLYSEGISGILTEQANIWFYKSNLGADELGNVEFTPAKPVMSKPSLTGISSGVLQLQDLESGGSKQVVINSDGLQGYVELDDTENWQPFVAFKKHLDINLRDPNVRMLDVNGDGKPEVVLSDQGAFWWWENEGKEGYGVPQHIPKPYDEEKGPAIVFQDQEQRIFLADMSGDGLTDIVRIRNGEVCYWANMGFGRFSAKVTMGNSPLFDTPDLFNPAYLQLADISGTGASDLLYLGKNSFQAYINLSGNAWSESTHIEPFVTTETPNKITVTDLLGNGTSCIVWSSELSIHKNVPMKYIDLMGGKKPHIMVSYENGTGKKTELEYKNSTSYYLEDKRKGTPWITRLPFPVQCVSKLIVTEEITQARFTTQYSYHHGYFDHSEREFRGFGRVEQTDTEDYDLFMQTGASNVTPPEHYQPPVLTKTWYHTGAFINRESILNQFKKEYWYEELKKQGFETGFQEYALPDAKINTENLAGFEPDNLWATTYREALRACKGMILRKEVFGLDATDTANAEQLKKQLTPYVVSTHNCGIQLIQPMADNEFAVFTVNESEAITYNYDRNAEDPRIAHTLNLSIDEFGNVLESATAAYPRIKTEELLADKATDNATIRNAKLRTRNAQKQPLITYIKNDFTNDIIDPTVYLLRKLHQTRTYEITGVSPSNVIFKIEELKGLDSSLPEIAYHQAATSGAGQKRLIEHIKTKYYNNDLSGPLTDGQLGIWGTGYESYQLAYTPNLLQDIFTPDGNSAAFEVTDADMLNGKFYQDNAAWWIRSGIIQFVTIGETIEDAKNRFLTPLSYTDPFESKLEVFYDPFHLFANRTLDALGNEARVLAYNYRTLMPSKSLDSNDNIGSALVDELGLVKASTLEGKDSNNDLSGEDGDNLSGLTELTDAAEQSLIDQFFSLAQVNDVCDYGQLQSVARQLLQSASVRMVYKFDQKPIVVASITREEHAMLGTESPLQISFEYSDGFGKVAMNKVQAEPGMTKKASPQPDGSWKIEEVDTGNQLRWVGNGRTVLNNKGNPIRQYEPYFSVSPAYESAPALVEAGVSALMFYDAPGRLIKTELPDGTFITTAFDPWSRLSFDANDTIKDSQWYQERIDLPDNNPEKKSAVKTEVHYNTPSTVMLDILGRPILVIDHNRFDDGNGGLKEELLYTHATLDIEGNALSVTDARGNKVMEYRYDMLGHRVMQTSMDAGKRWMLNNVLGNPVKTWDERKYEFSFVYDVLHRLIEKWVKGGEQSVPVNILFELTIYGEGLTNDKLNNLRGKPAFVYDSAGKTISETYDFKGNLLSATRVFAKDYKTMPNWDVPSPDDLLEDSNYTFTSSTEFDAINRPLKLINPDGSETINVFNAGGLLEAVTLKKGSSTTDYVQNIDYDEKGQRKSILYGNGVQTKYDYDLRTFRLKTLRTTKSNNEVLQDLKYTYDPTGNVTQIEDKAIPTVFYNNQKITGKNEYTYDALYRLIAASGREQSTSQASFGPGDNWNDSHAILNHNNGDPMAMHIYTQKYQYDQVGNLLQMKHIAGTHSRTRDYVYQSKNNRLLSTDIANSSYTYKHHPQHGYIIEMPHLPLMNWNFREELSASARQIKNDGSPETTYYVYNGNGQRVRKITENEADSGNTPTVKDERLYIGSYEVYRNEDDLERVSLHIMDDQKRIAMIDTETEPVMFLGIKIGSTSTQTIRYQLSNHLGSSSLELTETAEVISYEEYHPYGTTAYQAKNAAIKAASKRYRYTGMERDEETGLEYHSARYYLPWLGRWLSADPKGTEAGINAYSYSNNNPIILTDPSGLDARLTVDQATHTITYSSTVHFYGTQAEIDQVRPAAERATQFFTDASGTVLIDGTRWTVNYNVNFQYHETGASPLPTGIQSIIDQLVDPNSPVVPNITQAIGLLGLYSDAHQRSFASGTSQVSGYRAGDSVLTFSGHVGVGLTVQLLPSFLPIMRTFPEPTSRALMAINPAVGSSPEALFRTIIHEVGHTLGFDERYAPDAAHSHHERFESDFMTSLDPRTGITFDPGHREASASFAIYAANGQNINNATLRDFSVDSTRHGSVPQYRNGIRNEEYDTLQSTLRQDVWRRFRQQLAPPPPLPLIQLFPGPTDRQSPVQILPRYDERTLPGSIDAFRFHF
ncbi:insecticidal toxin complex protein [Fulvivirga ulvae]|uniref:SpvB/TcaC N-terminal domain-containing protein n=1 Tax=Fulvivirga ulvae TaxID=2904245 RepID=UPI001F48C471|nr:SpvB/TcaC N-terminal domain-containing protein [Fulvivirga ulvae]UII33140.1 insecticidal toxin complex protein [Fulvivirga ulvae]